jgi:hypothetical protein
VRLWNDAYSLLLRLTKRPRLVRFELFNLVKRANRSQLLQADLSSVQSISPPFLACEFKMEDGTLTPQSCVLSTLCTRLFLPKKFFAPVCCALICILYKSGGGGALSLPFLRTLELSRLRNTSGGNSGNVSA